MLVFNCATGGLTGTLSGLIVRLNSLFHHSLGKLPEPELIHRFSVLDRGGELWADLRVKSGVRFVLRLRLQNT
jgi:hypothetical protein